MANTKHLPREQRKRRKRAARRKLKELWASMTKEERKAFRQSDTKSLKAFLQRHRAEKAKASQGGG